MDDATKKKFEDEFGPNLIFESEDGKLSPHAIKTFQAFALSRMNCTHEELSEHVFPLDERLIHKMCKCGQVQFIQVTKACHDEMLLDKDLRNFPHKVKDHKIIEFAGIEVRIVE